MAKDNGTVKNISDVASVNDVKPRETLEGIRATIHNEVVDKLEEYAKSTKLDRAIVVEMALRTFFNVNKEDRIAAYDATMEKRQPSKVNIL